MALLDRLDESVLSRATRVNVASAQLEAGEPEGCLAAMSAGGAPEFAGVEPGRRAWLYAILARAELALGRPAAAAEWVARGERPPPASASPTPRPSVLCARAQLEESAERAPNPPRPRSSRTRWAPSFRPRGRARSPPGPPTTRSRSRCSNARSPSSAAVGDPAPRRGRARAPPPRRQGHRAPERATGTAGLASLSGREREVAELVALGRTNKEIAAELSLSEKTVESHMSRLFGKLGVRSHAEVAKAVGRERGDP